MTFTEIREKLAFKTVGIAGCGGLGSNCAVALARTGVGTLVLADFDIVSESNLNRQYFFIDQIGISKVEALQANIQRIDHSLKILPLPVRLTPMNIPALFAGCDVLVEAFDQADQKQMLIETWMVNFPEKPLVIGSGIAGWGGTASIHIREIDNLYICGDEQSEVSEKNPPLAPRVGIVANMQANVVLEILLR